MPTCCTNCSDCKTVRFTVLEVDGSTVHVQIEQRPCGCEEVPEENYGLLDVINVLGMDIVLGAAGFAEYVKNPETSECQWEIYSLTCFPVE